MIFAPLMTRRAMSIPHPSDVALQRFLRGTLSNPVAARTADYTVTQDEKATTLQLDVPGLAREQLQITLDGKRVIPKSNEGPPAHCPRPWEPQDHNRPGPSPARPENGVLTLTLAKQPPA